MSTLSGDTLRLTLFGRSHGPSVGMTLSGLPAGESVSLPALQDFLGRRAPGRSPLATARREADIPRFLSGIKDGVTTGEDITAIIENTDVKSNDYPSLTTVPRPGHADYTAYVKYGRIEPGGGPFSGRLTAPSNRGPPRPAGRPGTRHWITPPRLSPWSLACRMARAMASPWVSSTTGKAFSSVGAVKSP